jgi:hypothetical protein
MEKASQDMKAGYNFLYGGLMAEVLVEIEDLTSKKPGPTLTGKDYVIEGGHDGIVR